MTLPEITVELGLDFTETGGDFFTLDDATQGVLDNSEFTLAGLLYYDVSDRVRSLQVDRGKPRRFSTFPAGGAGVRFNNRDRAFDPLYADSPFFGQIVPRREIRITLGVDRQFTGFIDDWNLNYSLDGDSIADAVANDVTSFFAKQTLSAGTPIVELTGARINEVLDSEEVDWSPTQRDIDLGQIELGPQPIDANTNALTYLQKIAETEQAFLFIDKLGRVSYKTGTGFQVGQEVIVFGQQTGIPFSGIQVIYGSELLYNEILVENEGGTPAIANNLDSQDEYGIRNLSLTGLLGNNDADSQTLADLLLDRYQEPEYRIELLQVNLHKLTPAEQAEVLSLELGDIARVDFTPNDVGDPIERFVQVISIKHDVSVQQHVIRFGFQQTQTPIVLDDPILGKLESSVLGETNQAWTLGDEILGRLSAGMTLS